MGGTHNTSTPSPPLAKLGPPPPSVHSASPAASAGAHVEHRTVLPAKAGTDVEVEETSGLLEADAAEVCVCVCGQM